MSELIVFSDEQKKIIKNQFFPPSATSEDMIYCMNIAKNMGLNPITKEIFFVPRKSNVNGKWIEKIDPMLGRDSYVKVAHSTGLFAGMETDSKIDKSPKFENGEWVEKSDLVAVCKVWRKDTEKPFVVTVAYSEYVQLTKEGTPNKFWKEKPDTMLKKVAESQALRKAFSINGAYSIDEVNDIEQPMQPKPKQKDPLETEIIEAETVTEIDFNAVS